MPHITFAVFVEILQFEILTAIEAVLAAGDGCALVAMGTVTWWCLEKYLLSDHAPSLLVSPRECGHVHPGHVPSQPALAQPRSRECLPPPRNRHSRCPDPIPGLVSPPCFDPHWGPLLPTPRQHLHLAPANPTPPAPLLRLRNRRNPPPPVRTSGFCVISVRPPRSAPAGTAPTTAGTAHAAGTAYSAPVALCPVPPGLAPPDADPRICKHFPGHCWPLAAIARAVSAPRTITVAPVGPPAASAATPGCCWPPGIAAAQLCQLPRGSCSSGPAVFSASLSNGPAASVVRLCFDNKP